LPRVGLVHPEHTIGKNTIAAMQSGIVFGYAGLIDGLVGRIQKELPAKAKVIATGGYANSSLKRQLLLMRRTLILRSLD